jgi:hypothetical protein
MYVLAKLCAEINTLESHLNTELSTINHRLDISCYVLFNSTNKVNVYTYMVTIHYLFIYLLIYLFVVYFMKLSVTQTL